MDNLWGLWYDYKEQFGRIFGHGCSAAVCSFISLSFNPLFCASWHFFFCEIPGSYTGRMSKNAYVIVYSHSVAHNVFAPCRMQRVTIRFSLRKQEQKRGKKRRSGFLNRSDARFFRSLKGLKN